MISFVTHTTYPRRCTIFVLDVVVFLAFNIVPRFTKDLDYFHCRVPVRRQDFIDKGKYPSTRCTREAGGTDPDEIAEARCMPWSASRQKRLRFRTGEIYDIERHDHVMNHKARPFSSTTLISPAHLQT